MQGKRLYHTLRLCMTLGNGKRAEYLKKHHVFAGIGENCSFMDRVVPLFPNLIRLGNNVRISSHVSLLTHDGIQVVLNSAAEQMPEERRHRFKETIGCIEIGDNVFIGTRSIICPNVRIGNNVVVTAGSVVTNDIPSNCVVRGVPAKVICSFDQFYDLQSVKNTYPDNLKPDSGRVVGEGLCEWLWNNFHNSREKSNAK